MGQLLIDERMRSSSLKALCYDNHSKVEKFLTSIVFNAAHPVLERLKTIFVVNVI